nr:hypothetical protein [uncultured Sphaerochaeta sp.]
MLDHFASSIGIKIGAGRTTRLKTVHKSILTLGNNDIFLLPAGQFNTWSIACQAKARPVPNGSHGRAVESGMPGRANQHMDLNDRMAKSRIKEGNRHTNPADHLL